MKKNKTVSVQVSKVPNACKLFEEYYGVKRYQINSVHEENRYYFFMTKRSLYRRLMGSTPVIAVEWELLEDAVNITVCAYMDHQGDVAKVIGRILSAPEIGFAKMVTNALTDPLFGKAFCDEALVMSEGLLTIK